MTIGIAFTFCSFFYIVLLTIVYFHKSRIKTLENKIYSKLILTSLFGTIISLLCYYFMVDYEKTFFLNFIFPRLYLVYLITWIMLFTLYVIVISFPKLNFKKLNFTFLISYLILIIITIMLPLYYHTGIVYLYGPATTFCTIVSGIFTLIMLYCLFKNIKQIKQKKYLPLIFFLLLGTIILIIQRLNPGLSLITFGEAFITFLMYFTIENPDVKMITELKKNRLLVNQTNEEKSNLLFLVSNQIKEPIKKIQELSQNTSEIKDIETYQELVKEINNLSHSLSFQVENVMDISTLNDSNIKVIENKYNLTNLIEKICILKEKNIPNNVEFRVNIGKNIPKYLYGDSNLLEQIISSILNNAIKNTSQGFIELNINTISKYDMCRLIIEISDSGIGMSIDKVNYLLMLDEESEQKRLETEDVDINTIKKLISKIGGYFTIKSEENRGTEIKFVINQKIDVTNVIMIDNYLKKDKVLVASKDMIFLKNITKLIQNKGLEVETSVYANDILEKIRIKEEFLYIFIDDMLDKRAFEILKELQKDNKFKTPVIIMLDKDTEFIKEHFIEDGFNDYLLKDKLTTEIDRILNK